MLLQKKKLTLGFRDLCTLCRIGILPNELEEAQEILISLEVDVEVSSCFLSDSLEDTVDYTALMRCCKEVAAMRRYNLLETLVWQILTELGEEFPVTRALVTVVKPAFNSSFVKMERAYP